MGQSIAVKHGIEIATQPGNAGAVGVTTFITGASVYFEMLQPVIGFFAALLGGILTSLLIINAYKKGRDDRKMRRLERHEKHLIIEALEKDAEGE